MFLLSAAFLLLQTPSIHRAVEVRPGVFVLKGGPDAEVFAAAKAAGITHVLNLRKESEGDSSADALAARGVAAEYGKCPMDREPKADELDAFRTKLKALPKGARLLLHCASGNRVSGALYAYWVLDGGLEPAQALELAKKGGLSNPATEAAVKAYVATRMPAQSKS